MAQTRPLLSRTPPAQSQCLMVWNRGVVRGDSRRREMERERQVIKRSLAKDGRLVRKGKRLSKCCFQERIDPCRPPPACVSYRAAAPRSTGERGGKHQHERGTLTAVGHVIAPSEPNLCSYSRQVQKNHPVSLFVRSSQRSYPGTNI